MGTVVKPHEFLVDEYGAPKGVILGLAQYHKLLSFLEDLEDTLDLKHAVKTSQGKIDHQTLLSRLKKPGFCSVPASL